MSDSIGIALMGKVDVSRNFKEMRLELLNELEKVGRLVKKDFESTVSTWEIKPVFKYQKRLSGGKADGYFYASVEVSTEDWLYGYLNFGSGSDKRQITPLPRKPKVKPYKFGEGLYTYNPTLHGALTIPVVFAPKTRKGFIGSDKGTTSTETLIRARAEAAPIEARRWDEAIFEKWDKELWERIDKAVGNALAKYFS